MNKKILIAPSILSADFAKLQQQIEIVEKAGADWLHIDVMDGHFVPNITIGPVVVKSIKKVSKLVFDVHLMISEPEKYWKDFKDAGADFITFHAEAVKNPETLIRDIKKSGLKVGLSIKPKTEISKVLDYLPELDMVLVMSVEPGFGGQKFMPETLKKVESIRNNIEKSNSNCLLQIDGGINNETGLKAVKAGANVLVAGNSIFAAPDPANALINLKQQIDNSVRN